MKNLTSTVVAGLLALNVSLQAQDCTFYFPAKSGTSLETKTYNSKDKLAATVKSKVLDVSSNSIKFNSEVFDDKGKSLSKGDYEVKCESGEFVVDMKTYLKDLDMSKYQNMEVNVEAKNMSIPKKMEAGQKLNDGEITIKISNNGFKILTMSVKITNRTVAGIEDVTTPAGTFKCARISSDVESKTLFTVKSKLNEWVAENVGTVRSESRDQKDKIQSYTVLTSIN
jgi:hypothetical protein